LHRPWRVARPSPHAAQLAADLHEQIGQAERLQCLDHLVDSEGGEWYWAILPDGKPDLTQPKAGFWKCPYHNSRMCLELIERLSVS
jgi:mannose/cellobiose epimerase-like protein (N-acyl-D-glucosamine 2-epimerase family)